jgi:hypothetical protein
MKDLLPECVGKDGVAVVDDGAWDVMELDDVVEEDSSHLTMNVASKFDN